MEKKDTLSSCSDSEIQQMQLIQDKSKESCMVSFQRLHSHLKCLLNNDLKGSRTENGFKRAFATLFGQDLETFTGTMFLYMDQLQKQLDNEEFQEIGSMSAFKVLQTQFQMFIKSRFYLDDEYVDMIRNKFLQYTRLAIPEFRDTLIQHMESVKKSIGERAQHKMQYESRVNERQNQTTEEKTDTSNALDASSVIIESNGTESKEQDTSSRSGNDAHVDDADIRPIYAEEPMAEVQMTADDNVSATGQQHTEQPEFNNEGEVDQNVEQCHDTCNEAKVNNDIDEIETIKIELEHSVAKLLGENELLHKEKEHLKQTYKDLFDSIKTTRVQTKNHNDSLMAQLNKKSNENADIPTGHRFSIKRTSTVHEKTTSPRSCLRWQPTGRILKTVCLRWVPTGKIFTSSTTKVDSEPPNGSKEDITNQCESEQALDVSAGTLLSTADQASVFMAMMSDHNSSDLAPQRQEMSVENVSSGLVGIRCLERRLNTSVLASSSMSEMFDQSGQAITSEFKKTTTMNSQVQMLVPKVVP
ncbi:hypothetical protein Tco_0726236 [Tanacetum coccineum]|uniref:Uncharacterized protein n=1 Tax=Tanacetum coccineum TaxID=301880 RepID=A0ABQ4YFW4_9ASTR